MIVSDLVVQLIQGVNTKMSLLRNQSMVLGPNFSSLANTNRGANLVARRMLASLAACDAGSGLASRPRVGSIIMSSNCAR